MSCPSGGTIDLLQFGHCKRIVFFVFGLSFGPLLECFFGSLGPSLAAWSCLAAALSKNAPNASLPSVPSSPQVTGEEDVLSAPHSKGLEVPESGYAWSFAAFIAAK